MVSVRLSALSVQRQSPDGEIGRRTVFRSQRPQGCAGSNPVLGTQAPFRCLFYVVKISREVQVAKHFLELQLEQVSVAMPCANLDQSYFYGTVFILLFC